MKATTKKVLLLMALLCCFSLRAFGEPTAFPVRISPNRRYFVDANGKPVFWLGTTQWELFRGYRLEDAKTILEKTASHGFTFVQVKLLGQSDGNRPNVYGQKPLINGDALTPNEAYFQHVDAVVRAARDNNLVISMTIYHQSYRKYITLQKARFWAKWLAQRYNDSPNIVWSTTPEAKQEFVPILRELAAGLREGDRLRRLITFKPDPAGPSSSFIHNEEWLDFNSMQVWNAVHQIYPMVTKDYNLKPIKPTLMAEAAYEAGTEYGFNVTPLWVRREAYYSYLAGGHHTYGHNDSWRILPTWKEALDAPGAQHMGILRKIFEARPEWWLLVPDQSLFASGGQTEGKVLHLSARHQDGKWAMIYLADKASFSVNMDKLSGPKVAASWVKPESGESAPAGSYSNTGVQSFTTPEGWEDSLLILEATNALTTLPAFPLKLSADRRYLVDQRETPFLVVGDSPWSLIVEPTPEQADQYLDDRHSKGFNLLLVNLIEHKFSSQPPKLRDGTPPFTTPGDFGTPNEAYFGYAEEVVRKAAKRGIALLLCPAYLGYGGGDDGFYQEMLRNGPEKIRAYGRYVGRRFRDHPNLVWIVGGDFAPPPDQRWTVDEVAAGIREEDKVHLMTVHCGPGDAAAAAYGDRSWLQLNNVYHYREDLYAACLEQDSRSPRMPYFLVETAYEGEHNASPARIRRQAYWPLLCGAFGTLYGNSPVWHFGSRGVYDRGGDWVAALNSRGAQDTARLAAAFRARPWWQLRPDHDHKVVTAGYGTFGKLDYVTAASTSDGTLVLSYVPSTDTGPREFTVDMSQLASRLTAQWYNPTTGRYTAIPGSPFPNAGMRTFTTPGDNGTGTNDWLLVLEASRADSGNAPRF